MSYSSSRTSRRKKQSSGVLPLLLSLILLMVISGLGFAAYKLLLRPPVVVVETVRIPAEPPPKIATPPKPPRKQVEFKPPSNLERMDRPAAAAIVDGRPMNPAAAVDLVGKTLGEALGLGNKVLVIWLIDESASAAALRREVIDQIEPMYKSLKIEPTADGKPEDAPMLSAVVGFGAEVEFAGDQPLADAAEVKLAAEKLKASSSPAEMTFAALQQAVDKFAEYRTKKGRFISVVLVTDEAGDDEDKADEILPLLERYAIPVNCIGYAATFGSPLGNNRNAEGMAGDKVLVRQGPESRFPEWIHLDFPSGRDDSELSIDTQLGPYTLARVCKQTGGSFYALPPGGGGLWAGSGATLPKTYAPDYLSESAVQADIEKNKAKKALIEAAKLPQAEVLRNFQTNFDIDEDVQRTRALDTAQRPAAKVKPALETLYLLLKDGEADEPKLTEPRWKAGFDLAYGRAAAALARHESYIQQTAVMKSGKKGDLEPTDEPTGVSATDKMASKAREYLKRVIDEHPGTPWASAAERELREPMGWKRVER
jgi:hypothetical protein